MKKRILQRPSCLFTGQVSPKNETHAIIIIDLDQSCVLLRYPFVFNAI